MHVKVIMSVVSITLVIIVLLIQLQSLLSQQSLCSEGFIDADLLTAKAERISGGSQPAVAIRLALLGQDTRWLIDSLAINNGTIESLILGIDIRSVREICILV